VKFRDRVLYALERKEDKLDHIPIHDSPWNATVDRWRREGMPSWISPADYFGYHIAIFSPDLSPQLPIEVLYEDEEYIVERDSYGAIRRNHRDYSTTPELIDWPCKSRDDWEKLKVRLKPNERRVDWVTALREYHRAVSRGRFIMYGAAVGFDEVQHYVRTDILLKAVIKDPEWVVDMYRVNAKLAMDMCDIMMNGGFRFDGAFLYCDLGYRVGLFFSPRYFEEQLHPVFKELCSFFKSRGMYVFLHSCGRVKDLIPYFIEEGIDVLQPLEVKAGMDLVELKERYGDRIAFMGGIDVRLMALTDLKPLEEEMKRKITVAKQGGGYIYHSDHSVPKNVSFENYKKVIEFALKYGSYDK
jgi:uroporphyrinogen decarboxylase